MDDWIRRFEADPLEVVGVCDQWRIDAVQHVEDPGEAPSRDFQLCTTALVRWADLTTIDGAGSIDEVCRQAMAAADARARSAITLVGEGDPSIIFASLFGKPADRDARYDAMRKAIAVIERIRDKAIGRGRVLDELPAVRRSPAEPLRAELGNLLLHPRDLMILEWLKDRWPELQSIAQIVEAFEGAKIESEPITVGRNDVAKRLKDLAGRGLVEYRGKGRKRLWGISPKGRELLSSR